MTVTVTTTRHWLLVIEGDVYPILIGPLDEHELLPRARSTGPKIRPPRTACTT